MEHRHGASPRPRPCRDPAGPPGRPRHAGAVRPVPGRARRPQCRVVRDVRLVRPPRDGRLRRPAPASLPRLPGGDGAWRCPRGGGDGPVAHGARRRGRDGGGRPTAVSALAVLGGYYAAAVPALVLPFLLAGGRAGAGGLGARPGCSAGASPAWSRLSRPSSCGRSRSGGVSPRPWPPRSTTWRPWSTGRRPRPTILPCAPPATPPPAKPSKAATEQFWTSSLRPSGPSAHDRAFVLLLGRAALGARAHQAGARQPFGGGWRRRAADGLRRERPRQRGRAARRTASRTSQPWRTAAPRTSPRSPGARCTTSPWGVDPAQVVAQLRRSFAVRVLSYAVLAVAANVDLARGAVVDRPSSVGCTAGAGHRLDRVGAAAPRDAWCRQLRPDGVWLRSALRVGVALGVAVAVAQAGDLPNSFWVGLGALTALRSNALGTGYTVLQALAGTVARLRAGGRPGARWRRRAGCCGPCCR